MSTVQIKTPFNVLVAARQAGVGWRTLAFFLDFIFILLYVWTVSYVFFDVLGMDWASFEGENAADFQFDLSQFLDVVFTVLLFPAIFYSLWTEYFLNGQTFGKAICGIRVVKLDGYRAGFAEYFTRWVFRIIDFWTGFFMLLIFIPIFGEENGSILSMIMMFSSGLVAFFLILRTDKSQRLGDIIAGTTVLKLKEKHSIKITILEEIQDSYQPKYSQVMRLTDNDARIIKDTFIMAKKNKDHKTLKKLRTKLESVMEVESNQKDLDFIETVMKDFNYYTQK